MGGRALRGIGAILAGVLLVPLAQAISTGIKVVPGDTRITEISSTSDTDVYTFEGLEDSSVTVVVTSTDGSLEPGLSIIDEFGTPYPLGASLIEDGGTARIRSFKLPDTGTYFIVVSGKNSSTGEYSLKFRGKPAPSPATTVVTGGGGFADVAFTGLSDGTVAFTVTPPAGVKSKRPLLLDPDAAEVPGASARMRHTTTGWAGTKIRLTDAEGTYTLRCYAPPGTPLLVHVVPGFQAGKATRVRIPVLEPTVTDVDPGTVLRGNGVTITGTNFSGQVRVFLSIPLLRRVECSVTSVALDGTTVNAQVPLVDGNGDPVPGGGYTVEVSNPEGQAAEWAGTLSVNAPGVPGSSQGIDPTTGPAAGGTVVTITGAGFNPAITAAIRDDAGDTPLAVTWDSSTQIHFTMPAHAAGTVSIVLQNPLATEVVRADAFTFTDSTTSQFFDSGTASALPTVSQSGDPFAASRGAIVDINGDGQNDILLQSTSLMPEGASLRILLQDTPGVFVDATHGSIPDRFGGFQSPVDLGEGPGLAVGDLDGDSFPDIVCTGFYAPKTVSPYASEYAVDRNGSGGFFGFTYSAGKVGEFSIFWNEHYSATRIFKNDGEGNFFSSPLDPGGSRRIPNVGFYVSYYGQKDAADASFLATKIAYNDTAGIQQHRFTGDPGFVVDGGISFYSSRYGYPAAEHVYGLKVDYDQYPNGNWEPPGEQGGGTFVPSGGERFQGSAVAIGDLDGDGSNDLVVGSSYLVYESRAIEFDRTGFEGGVYFRSYYRPSTRVLLNTKSGGKATGSFVEDASPLVDPSQFEFPDTGYGDFGQATDIAVGDLNGDGLPDLVLAQDTRFTLSNTRVPGVTEYRPGTRIFINRGLAVFDDATRSNMPTVDVAPAAAPDFYAASRIALGDLDNDGDLDLVISTATGAYVDPGRPWTRVLLNRDGVDGPTGIFDDMTDTNMPATSGAELWQANSVLLHDVDGDGDLDLVLATTDGGLTATSAGTRVLLNDGTGLFEQNPAGIAADTFIPPWDPAENWAGDLVLMGDLDGDGKDDILVSVDDPSVDPATRILLRR